MTHVLTLRVPAHSVEEISDRVWTQEGVAGIQEAPLGGDMFAVREDFEVLEFGSEAARRCADWLEKESFRQGAEIRLHVYMEVEAGFDAAAFVQSLDLKVPVSLEGFRSLEAEDYLENYKKSVTGTVFGGDTLWIGPPWAEPPVGVQAFWVEPGLAFGTGGHPTTQLCFERLKDLSRDPASKKWKSFLDLGTGTGILGVAVRTFFPTAELWVSDLDPLCADEVRKTFDLNKMSARTPGGYFGNEGSAAAFVRKGLRFDVVVSNIYAEILTQIVSDVQALLPPGGRWIVSGILRSPAEQALLSAIQGRFKVVWEQMRVLEGTKLDSQGGLKASQETWVAYDFEKLS